MIGDEPIVASSSVESPSTHCEDCRQLWQYHSGAGEDMECPELSDCLEDNDRVHTRAEKGKELVEDFVRQFGYWNPKVGGYHTGGLSVFEDAFSFLGWEDDPHVYPGDQCKHKSGCKKKITCGTPTPDGYLSCCGDHYRESKV